MLLQVILEGLGLGILLVLVCAVGIRKGAVGMVHLYPMGQPFASVQPRLYAGVQRFEKSFRQRLFPVSCKGRGQRDENADREDRIWGQAMKMSKEKRALIAGMIGCLLYVIGDFLFAATWKSQSTESIGLMVKVA